MADVSDVKAEDIKEISDSLDSLSCKLTPDMTDAYCMYVTENMRSAYLDPCPVLDWVWRSWHFGEGVCIGCFPWDNIAADEALYNSRQHFNTSRVGG